MWVEESFKKGSISCVDNIEESKVLDALWMSPDMYYHILWN